MLNSMICGKRWTGKSAGLNHVNHCPGVGVVWCIERVIGFWNCLSGKIYPAGAQYDRM